MYACPCVEALTDIPTVYGWRSGLKTGQYYLRTRPSVAACPAPLMARSAVAAIQFTVSKEVQDEAKAFAKAGAAKDATTKAALTSITNGASKLAISTPVLAKVMAPRSVERVAPPPPSATDSPSPSPTPLPDEDISYEEALRRKEEKELAEEKLLCSCVCRTRQAMLILASLANPDSCVMCSG